MKTESKLFDGKGNMPKEPKTAMDRMALGFRMSKLAGYRELVSNGRVIRELLHGNSTEIADSLYDAAHAYIANKRYKEAEICLNEIVQMKCWRMDPTLEPAVYSSLAVVYFNVTVKNHASLKYKKRDFAAAVEYVF